LSAKLLLFYLFSQFLAFFSNLYELDGVKF
jgi:hypothetical protein